MVGQTIFCIHPKSEFEGAAKVGGTKKLDIPKIISLRPDLIIANKEENEKEQIEELEKHFSVWISDIVSVDDALDMIRSLGDITQTQSEANELIQKISERRTWYNNKVHSRPKVIYLIWNNPYLAVGKNTFIDSMIHEAGFENIIAHSRYPEIGKEELVQFHADLVLLSSEPFPFKEKHKQEINQILGKKKAVLVDGEMFSWYGSRMEEAFHYFAELKSTLHKLTL